MTKNPDTRQDPDTQLPEIDIEGIMRLIPHRYPFLLVDRLTAIIPGESAVGIKNITMNEFFFPGHFPGHPVMPGVLIVEALAQTAGVLVMHSRGEDAHNEVVYFTSIENARFRRTVVPGDVLHLKVTKERHRGSIWKFSGHAMVGSELAAEAVFSAMIVKKER